jgi:hypothetical protein
MSSVVVSRHFARSVFDVRAIFNLRLQVNSWSSKTGLDFQPVHMPVVLGISVFSGATHVHPQKPSSLS